MGAVRPSALSDLKDPTDSTTENMRQAVAVCSYFYTTTTGHLVINVSLQAAWHLLFMKRKLPFTTFM